VVLLFIVLGFFPLGLGIFFCTICYSSVLSESKFREKLGWGVFFFFVMLFWWGLGLVGFFFNYVPDAFEF